MQLFTRFRKLTHVGDCRSLRVKEWCFLWRFKSSQRKLQAFPLSETNHDNVALIRQSKYESLCYMISRGSQTHL